ncbi:retropepsin-like aspartic protease family protein [Lujinxingia litoralis]|uniref:retropepsin-like aspartic protease family protein n=1 Tax=Lujinxingia litoralis TaxID=2211119 RepID=UPI0011B94242|nr:retropepsin-like aspartic protease [Lujinxingia litoralis]
MTKTQVFSVSSDDRESPDRESPDRESPGGIVIEAGSGSREAIVIPGISDMALEGSEGDEPGTVFSSPVTIEHGEASAPGGVGTRTLRLTFERNGASVLVPAKIGHVDVYFVLDTGASYTTLTAGIARQARVTPPEGAPTTLMQTAGGLRPARFGLMETLKLGDHTLRNVSYTICDECGFGHYRAKPIVGLLGLNVLQRFRMNMDHLHGVVELTPHADFENQSADLRPWLSLQLVMERGLAARGARTETLVQVRNWAQKSVRGLVVELTCQLVDGRMERVRTRQASVGARAVANAEPRQSTSACQHWQAEVIEGYWR